MSNNVIRMRCGYHNEVVALFTECRDDVARKMVYSVAHIISFDSDSDSQVNFSSGFFFRADGGDLVFVTCNHCVKGSNSSEIPVRVLNSDDSLGIERLQVRSYAECWYPHPDPEIDLCACLVSAQVDELEKKNFHPLIHELSSESIVGPDELMRLSCIEDIIVVGYPRQTISVGEGVPTTTRGVTGTPWGINSIAPRYRLIDAKVNHGSSGSPVFLDTRHDTMSTEPRLLGVVCKSMSQPTVIYEVKGENPAEKADVIDLNYGLALATGAEHIQEIPLDRSPHVLGTGSITLTVK